MLEQDSLKLEVIKLDAEGLNQQQIANATGVPRSTVGAFLRRDRYKDWWDEWDSSPSASGSLHDHHNDIERATGSCFILMAAQNNTWVHTNGLKSIQHYAKLRDAKIMVGTFLYNMNGFQNLQKDGTESDEVWFDPSIKPYIVDKPMTLAEGLIWHGGLNILPTAVNPLSGLHGFSRNNSGVVPHAKIMLESLPSHKSDKSGRTLYTTGAITLQNYIQKKEGQKAAFHHAYGALLVEVDKDGVWFARQLNIESETGCFYDLNYHCTPTGCKKVSGNVEAMNWGDLHVEKMDPVSYGVAFFNKDSILDTLRPKHQILHDSFDFSSRNHHNISDCHFRYKMFVGGTDTVEGDIQKVGEFFNKIHRPWCKTVVVDSNHDRALTRWLKSADYKSDPANAVLFLDCQTQIYRSIKENNKDFSVFKYAVETHGGFKYDALFLKEDQSFMLCGDIECGMHGDTGVGGSRGSISQYQRLGTRCNVGHSHSPAIRDGVYVAGVTGSLDMGYNVGLSTWQTAHIVTYVNGKRAIIATKKEKWRSDWWNRY